jgi:LacI family transcriptional regulator, galactose operon repressor
MSRRKREQAPPAKASRRGRASRPPLPGRRATIRDVADRAGVSTATVSFVLNGNPNERITEVVKTRVLGAARELSYHANAAAAALARKRIRNIGIVFYKDDSISNNFYSFVVQGAVKEAVERNYNLLFSYVETTYKGLEDLPKMVREKNAEGVLFMRRVHPNMIKDIAALPIPVVLIDTFPRVAGVNALQIDNVSGGRTAGDYLFTLGHKHIAMLAPRDAAPSIEQRLTGFRASFEQFERRFSRSANVVPVDELTFYAAHRATASLLAKRGPLTGLFCANDEMAAGALRAAHEAGLEVPRDLSVIGFDDIVLSNYTDPPLTTIGVVKEHMGRRAVARLIELVEGVDHTVKVELAPVKLVVRGSTSGPGSKS